MEIDPRLRADAGPPSSSTTASRPSYFQRPSSLNSAQQSAPLGHTQHSQPYPPPSSNEGSQHGSYQPLPTQSTGKLSSSDNNAEFRGHGSPGTGPDGGANDIRRPRACEACRGLKVRCEFDALNPDGACNRCAKAHRNCVVTVPSRKRQKKTDSRVAELEKKIDALTATLQAAKSGSLPHEQKTSLVTESPKMGVTSSLYEQVTNGSYGGALEARPDLPGLQYKWNSPSAQSYPKPIVQDLKKTVLPLMVIAGQKRKQSDRSSSNSTPNSTSSGRASSITALPIVQGARKSPAAKMTSGGNDYSDVIDRGVVTSEMASHMFNRYVTKMAPLMPAVVFPPGTTAADIRKTKPVLFLAILGAGSGMDHPDLQKVLTKEVMAMYADRIICCGEKTLELIQALLVSTLWYWPPEHFEELKFYQLVHLAAVMAIDININKKNKARKSLREKQRLLAGLWRDHPWRRIPFPDSESIEARRAWCACYFLACNTSMGLRRPNLIRWTDYLQECVEVLATSPDAAQSDKTLCQWVRSQHIAEEVGIQFSMDDPFATVNISDSKVQYALKGFERDLALWREQIPKEVQSPMLNMTYHLLNIYMHEVAMHVDHNIEEFHPPFTEEALSGGKVPSEGAPLTPQHISALSTCLTSIDGLFESFLALDIDVIRTLPVLHFVRVAYATVVLIKMYFAAAAPHSELGRVIEKDDMKVEIYLDRLLEHFRAVAAEDKSRPASKFLMVLIMLKTWFHRQRGSKRPETADAGGQGQMVASETPGRQGEEIDQKPIQQPCQQQHRDYSPANTPLQLLSEVATGTNATQSVPESRHPYNNDWQQPQPYAYSNQGYNTVGMPYPVAGMDANLGMLSGMEYDVNLGDEFEQAMGMTLGDGDFGKYFGDEAFFGAMIGSFGSGPLEGFDPGT
ncbi:MAG: hypothetical protein M1818_003423 [Claussenomyces sp. TS43310]|nr:MAG: hypothetical protein M1818_003423 [Claussenomyces sp. TS43310]